MREFIITERKKCTGCSLCAYMCPMEAISMKEDIEGFSYPEINQGRCISCMKCKKICPQNTPVIKQMPRERYLAQNREGTEALKSTSGGVASAFMKGVFLSGGTGYGAVFDRSMRVVHNRAESPEEALPFSGSKYVQSDISGVFNQLSDDLKNRTVS